MLSLSHPVRRIAGVDLAQDTSERSTWYVLPATPSVVRIDGVPQVSLLKLVRDGELSQGNLHLRVSLAWPAQQLDEARAILEQEEQREVSLLPLPVIGAEAEVIFAGREPVDDGEVSPFEVRRYARTQPQLDAPHQASLSTTLNAEGTRLFDAALRGGGAPLGVTYRLHTEALRPGLQVIARVDWGRTYEHFSANRRTGGFVYTEDVRQLVEELVEQKVVQISAVSALDDEGSGAGAEAVRRALAWVQRQVVERFCTPVMELKREPARASLGTIGEVFSVGSAYQVKRLTQVERAVAELRLDVQTVVRRTLLTQAHLADLLGDANPDEHIEDVEPDHPFFKRFALRLRSARKLGALGVKELNGEWLYGDRQIPLRLTAEQPQAEVSTWRDGSEDTNWAVIGEVLFDDDAPAHAGQTLALPTVEGREQELTLDLDALLGLRRFEVITVPDPERVLATRVRVRHMQGDDLLEEQELVFAANEARATATFAAVREGHRFEAQWSWFLVGGRRLEAEPVALDTTILRIPPPYAEAFTVQLISAEDWTDLDRLIVHVRKTLDGPGHTLIFAGPSQFRAVSLDLPDPSDRSFYYRVQRFWGDGREEDDQEVQTDVAVVLVGGTPATRLVVDFEPLGIELPSAGIHMVMIELTYIDPPNQVRHLGQLEIRALADRPRWDVELADPTQRTYEYRITTYRTSGATQVGPWTKTAERLVVVPIVSE